MTDTNFDTIPDALASAPWEDWLGRRRWFAGKSTSARISLEASVPAAGMFLCLVRSADDLYFAPIGRVDDSREALVVLRGQRWGDALESADCVRGLLELCVGMPRTQGSIGLVPETRDPQGLEKSRIEGAVVLGSPDQTNSWARCGNEFLKVYRRLEREPNLDVEVLQKLAHREDLAIPRLRATFAVSYDGVVSIVVAVQKAIEHQGGAWERACADVLAVATGGRPEVESWNRLGRRTAELHRAMSEELGWRVATHEDSTATSRNAAKLARDVVKDLAGSPRDSWTESVAELADRVLEGSASLIASLEAPLPEGTPFQRVHGDFHLGQVLRVDDDWVILDFEGEPARSPAERRAMAPAAKDVSGMLRSFDYATRAGLPEGADDTARLRVAEWKRDVRSAFLDGYFATPGILPVWPVDSTARASLLAFYEAEKAFYELRYELAHRPDWLAIPLGGLLALATTRA